MSTARTRQQALGFVLTEPNKAALFDVQEGVAARVGFVAGHGTFHASDSLKVMIDPGDALPYADFATPKALSTATAIVQISQDEMRGVSRLAVVKNGTSTSGFATAEIVVTQDLD